MSLTAGNSLAGTALRQGESSRFCSLQTPRNSLPLLLALAHADSASASQRDRVEIHVHGVLAGKLLRIQQLLQNKADTSTIPSQYYIDTSLSCFTKYKYHQIVTLTLEKTLTSSIYLSTLGYYIISEPPNTEFSPVMYKNIDSNKTSL